MTFHLRHTIPYSGEPIAACLKGLPGSSTTLNEEAIDCPLCRVLLVKEVEDALVDRIPPDAVAAAFAGYDLGGADYSAIELRVLKQMEGERFTVQTQRPRLPTGRTPEPLQFKVFKNRR